MPIPPLVGPSDLTTLPDDLNNTLTGSLGADCIHGLGGNDNLLGGDGSGDLDGGAGHDTLSAGRSDDTLVGGAGIDCLLGGSGNQQRYCGEGDDSLRSGDRYSTLGGGTGNDILQANFAMGATDVLTGGAGLDSSDVTGVSILNRIGTASSPISKSAAMASPSMARRVARS